jgi:integration host factor subunit alpha
MVMVSEELGAAGEYDADRARGRRQMANLTKGDLIEGVHAGVVGLSRAEASAAIDAVFGTIKEALEDGEEIKLPGFGNFGLREKKERNGRNPHTGAPITISARRIVNFKASNLLKNRLEVRLIDQRASEPIG